MQNKTKRRKVNAEANAKPTDRVIKSVSVKRHHIDTLSEFSQRVRDESGLIADRSKLFQLFAELIDAYGTRIELDHVTNVNDLSDAIIEALQKKSGD